MENQTDQWKDVKGYEGLYQVSNEGRIKSLKWGKEKILKCYKNDFGYMKTVLCKDGKTTTFQVHRLGAEAWIPNLENKPCIDHINCVRHDNRVENLRWVTQEENVNNPITLERVTLANQKKGEELSKTVLVYDREYNLALIEDICQTYNEKLQDFTLDDLNESRPDLDVVRLETFLG